MIYTLFLLIPASPIQCPMPKQAPPIRQAKQIPTKKVEPYCSSACTCGCNEGAPCRCESYSGSRSITPSSPILIGSQPTVYAPQGVHTPSFLQREHAPPVVGIGSYNGYAPITGGAYDPRRTTGGVLYSGRAGNCGPSG